ncbi:MAG TPA: HAD family phosphatase [Mycobacteriales bacterium]|jgi:HAD superfamily hydrolase (TIGR01509 family)|nr:HAD family phosphatase [Mycobacteriales bacterium]
MRAVLFDMDGLLVDSEPLWTIGEIELAAHLGGTWSDELKAAIIGTRLDTAIATILEWYDAPRGQAEVESAMGFLLDRMVELYRRDLPLMPGAVELIDSVRAAGAATALVSSSYRVLVDAVLAVIGADRFDTSVAGDEVGQGKPDPEPYLTACKQLAVKPSEAVVLEDAISGVRSAEAAGCQVVAVPWIAPIDPAPGRYVVATLSEITADWLLSVGSSGGVPPNSGQNS